MCGQFSQNRFFLWKLFIAIFFVTFPADGFQQIVRIFPRLFFMQISDMMDMQSLVNRVAIDTGKIITHQNFAFLPLPSWICQCRCIIFRHVLVPLVMSLTLHYTEKTLPSLPNMPLFTYLPLYIYIICKGVRYMIYKVNSPYT